MKFLAVAALLAGAAVAAPTSNTGGGLLCPVGLYSVPQCCSVDVLGIADLNCKSPDQTPGDGADFQRKCAEIGKQAACCVVPILGQSLLCNKPPA